MCILYEIVSQSVVNVVKPVTYATNKFSNNMFTKQDVHVQGTVKKGFEAVKEVFENNFKNGEELSAQVCVYKKGEKVNN